MKVVFLDIDGVLNSQRVCIATGGISHTTRGGGLEHLDPIAIALIRGICRAAGAEIVLSSTWRKHADWKDYGTDMDLPITDRTSQSSTGNRGEEIAEWLRAHPETERYAIIDDDSDMLPEQLPYFVHTSGMEGFIWKDAVLLAEILGVDVFDAIYL